MGYESYEEERFRRENTLALEAARECMKHLSESVKLWMCSEDRCGGFGKSVQMDLLKATTQLSELLATIGELPKEGR